VILYSLRNQVAGLGSDSFHHTLIPQLIIWNRGLPISYAPAYPEIITLNYHTGFHIVSAILSMLSGWDVRLIVLLMLPLLVVGSGLAIGYFIYELCNEAYSVVYATIIPLFLTAFPIGMLEWGRYPQTLGLIFLTVFFAEYIKLSGELTSIGDILKIALLGSTIVYVHYRVTIMTFVGVGLWEVGNFLAKRKLAQQKVRLINLTKISILGILFLLPLFVTLIKNASIGYFDPLENPTTSFYEISRLGEQNIVYLPHLIVFVMLVPITIILIFRKEKVGIWLLTWWTLMVILSISFRDVLRYNIDPVTVISSLYIPIGLLIGYGLSKVIWRMPRYFLLFSCILVVIGGIMMFIRLQSTVPVAAYVTQDDLIASEWIKKHTPVDSCFMINTFNFDFSANFIIGSDGGGWLPLIAQRCVITYPMTTNVERFDHPEALSKPLLFHRLYGNLITPEAIDLMRKYHVQYVYTIKTKKISGSYIDPVLLKKSPSYKLVYRNRSVLIFELIAK
jgi:hypothetical protein